MTPKLTPAQRRDLLAAAENGGIHLGTTYGPFEALVVAGLADPRERTADERGRGYGFVLTPAGRAAAAALAPPACSHTAGVHPNGTATPVCAACGALVDLTEEA